jgi:hypothetical protein
MTDDKQSEPAAPQDRSVEPRKLTPAAERALAEAEQRRRERGAQSQTSSRELGGQAGPEPTRYGDWEKAGIVSDF